MCGPQVYTYCQAPIRLDLPEGGSVWYQRNGYCGFAGTGLDTTPSLSVAYLRAEAGEGQPAIDNRVKIGQVVSTHNDAVAPGGCACSVAPSASVTTLGLLCALAALRARRRKRT